MKFVRTIVIILFILAAAAFGISKAVELKNRDTSIPEITSDREVLEIPCDYTEEQLMEGLTACDAKDGDLTAEIVAGNFSRFLSPGLCDLTYVVFDSSNQPGSLTRRVRFTDYHSPDFTLTDPLVFEESEGSYTTVMDQIGASDMLEGDLSDWVVQTDSDANYQKRLPCPDGGHQQLRRYLILKPAGACGKKRIPEYGDRAFLLDRLSGSRQ